MASERTWRATLLEARRQALLHLSAGEPSGSSTSSTDASGDWVKVAAPPDPGEAEWSELWPQHQWHVAFEILFCQMPTSAKSLRPHQDDLLFFVPLLLTEVAAGGQQQQRQQQQQQQQRQPPPLLVRRRGAALPAELAVGGARAAEVDWRASMLLNLALQTGYCLSVAACRHADLPQLVDREGPGQPPAGAAGNGGSNATCSSTGASSGSSSTSGSSTGGVHEVCKVVYASPSRVHLSLDSSSSSAKGGGGGGQAEPAPCYPSLAFAVEDFDQAFSSVVLADPDDCYCVLLYAEARDSWDMGPESTATAPAAAAAAAAPGTQEAPAAGAGAGAGPSTDALSGQLEGLRLHGPAAGAGASAGEAPGQAAGGGSGRLVAAAGQGPRGLAATASLAQARVPEQPQQQQQEEQQQGQPGPSGGGVPLVFSGFVSHALLADAMAPKLRGGLLSGGGWAQRTSRVVMRGPGGVGEAEVAVTSMPLPPAGEGEAKQSPGFSLGKVAKGVVDAARRAAGGAGGGAGGGGRLPLRLQCALMTLLVPVDQLAASVLQAL